MHVAGKFADTCRLGRVMPSLRFSSSSVFFVIAGPQVASNLLVTLRSYHAQAVGTLKETKRKKKEACEKLELLNDAAE